MGSEIGNHSYTHLINPPTTTFTATTVGDTPAGSTQMTLDTVPSFAGVTVGMVVTGLNIGANTPLPARGEGGPSPTPVTAVSGNTMTSAYVPGGYGTANDGVLGDIPAGTTLTFAIPTENTNFLQTGRHGHSGTGNPSPTTTSSISRSCSSRRSLAHPIYGAAIPGAQRDIRDRAEHPALLPVRRRTAHADTPAM